jgi:hypothetical protein
LGINNYFRFGSVFIKKKVTKPNYFFLNPKPGPTRPVSVRFGFLGQKPVQTGLARSWLDFFGLARFFSGLAWFFSDLSSV